MKPSPANNNFYRREKKMLISCFYFILFFSLRIEDDKSNKFITENRQHGIIFRLVFFATLCQPNDFISPETVTGLHCDQKEKQQNRLWLFLFGWQMQNAVLQNEFLFESFCTLIYWLIRVHIWIFNLFISIVNAINIFIIAHRHHQHQRWPKLCWKNLGYHTYLSFTGVCVCVFVCALFDDFHFDE